MYALILMRSRLGLLHIVFRGMALDQRYGLIISYPEQIDRISPNFIYALILTRSSLGL